MRTRDDEGSALLVVLGMMMVLTLIVTVAATLAMRTASFARHSNDWNAALAAAEAGVDDYLARLNRDDNYWVTSPDCTNVAMQKPNVSRCSWGSTTAIGWADVPHSDRAEFHYDVVTTSTPVNGTIKLTSTGRVGSVTRTVSTVLRRGGFGEFLYYTVYETIDPANEAVYGLNNATAQDKCSNYAWDPTTPRPKNQSIGGVTGCVNIQFGDNDKINGPLHTNDTILTGGNPLFQGTVTTSDPACQPVNGVARPATSCYAKNGTSNPQFDKGINYRAEVELPTSIGDLSQHVDPTKTSTPGCLYTGPTRIKLIDDGSTYSKMKVWSPFTISGINAGCGGTRPNGVTVTIPNNNLVMVRNVPSNEATSATSVACTGGAIGDGYPLTDDINRKLNEANCGYGTLYVEGQLAGRLTFSAANNIVITGDLTYSGGKTGLDALGLIAENSVKIYHPVKSTCSNPFSSSCSNYTELSRPNGAGIFKNAKVYAAILTLQHSFTVQMYDEASNLGTLSVFGTIAQRFRGPVGLAGGTGFTKSYEYDTRLRYSPPPFFLDPVRSSWGVKAYGESTPAY